VCVCVCVCVFVRAEAVQAEIREGEEGVVITPVGVTWAFKKEKQKTPLNWKIIKKIIETNIPVSQT